MINIYEYLVPQWLKNISYSCMFDTHVLYLLILCLLQLMNFTYEKQIFCLLAINLYLKPLKGFSMFHKLRSYSSIELNSLETNAQFKSRFVK
jgi:hypothetical protein